MRVVLVSFFFLLTVLAEDAARDNALEIAAFNKRFISDDARSGLAPSGSVPKMQAELDDLMKSWNFTQQEIDARVQEIKSLGINSLRVREVKVSRSPEQSTSATFKMRHGKPIIGRTYTISIVNNQKIYNVTTTDNEEITVYDDDIEAVEPMRIVADPAEQDKHAAWVAKKAPRAIDSEWPLQDPEFYKNFQTLKKSYQKCCSDVAIKINNLSNSMYPIQEKLGECKRAMGTTEDRAKLHALLEQRLDLEKQLKDIQAEKEKYEKFDQKFRDRWSLNPN